MSYYHVLTGRGEIITGGRLGGEGVREKGVIKEPMFCMESYRRVIVGGGGGGQTAGKGTKET